MWNRRWKCWMWLVFWRKSNLNNNNIIIICETDFTIFFYFLKRIDPKDPQDAEKYEVVVNGLRRKLIIKKCDPKTDRGRYECKCGVVTTGTEFFVKPALKFVKELTDTEAIEEDTVELTVEVTKPNQKVKWIRNGRTVNPNEDRFAGRY